MFKHAAGFTIAILLTIAVVAVALIGVGPLDGILDEGAVRKGLDLVGGSVSIHKLHILHQGKYC